jgi:hypothetical protein
MLFLSAYSKISPADSQYLLGLVTTPDKKSVLSSKIEILSNTYANPDAKITVAANMTLISNSIVAWVRTSQKVLIEGVKMDAKIQEKNSKDRVISVQQAVTIGY